MLKVLLIRSGNTEYECQGRVQGTLDVPLSEDGRKQVEDLADALSQQQIDILYYGPCKCAQQSMEIINQKLDLKTKKLDAFQNLDHGLWQGMLIEDVKTKQPKVYKQWQEHPESVCPPNGETIQQVRDRVQTALTKLAKKHKDATIGILVAEPLMTVMHSMLAQEAVADMWGNDNQDNSQWELLELPAEVAAS